MEEEILKYLNQNAGLHYRELVDFFITKFPNETKADYDYIRDVLDTLISEGLIKTRLTSYKSLGAWVLIPGDPERNNQLFTLKVIKERNNVNIEAKITINGRRELEELNFKKQLEAVNSSVIATNKIQKKLGLGTLLIAALSFIAIAFSAYYSSQSVTPKEILKLDSTLQSSKTILDSMRQFQKGIDSSLRKAIKDR